MKVCLHGIMDIPATVVCILYVPLLSLSGLGGYEAVLLCAVALLVKDLGAGMHVVRLRGRGPMLCAVVLPWLHESIALVVSHERSVGSS